jgi:hypothetical protein
MPSFQDRVEFEEVRAIRESAYAILCVIEGDQAWIAHSQIDDESGVKHLGDEGTLVVSEWIARTKGLI